MGKQMVRVAMNTSNFLGQTSLCKSSIAQSRMCCIALFSASGNPSVQKVPIPQASALRLKSILQKCAACIHRMQNTRGLGTAQQAFWIWFLEIRFKNCKLVPACTACRNYASFCYEVKCGKYTSLKGAQQKWFVRFRFLDAVYNEYELKVDIVGKAEHHSTRNSRLKSSSLICW